MTLIIGLGNRARHGKDSFAKSVEDHFATQYYAAVKHGLAGYKPVIVQQVAFADALYREVNEWLKVTTENGRVPYAAEGSYVVPPTDTSTYIQIPEWVKPTPNAEVSARAPYGKHAKLLQWWGTEYRRSQDSDYWIKQWKAALNPKANIVLTTDMRFLNEAAAIKSVGGVTVQVNRKNQDGTRFIDGSRDPNHVSEVELDGYNYDYEITVKTGDLALLDQWAIALVYNLRALKGHK